MSDGDACVGDVFADEVCYLGESVDAVVDEEHLSVAAHLEVYGVDNHFFVEGVNLCLHWESVWRRCLYDAHVACSHERELQCSRYGCGAHGECIDVGLHLAQPFLDSHSELLLLVDDEQSEVAEFHCFPYQFMCAYDDVDASVLKVVEHLPCLFCGACA